MSRALVLAAHGSRSPASNALVRRLADSIRGRRLFDEVAVAFHQGEPRFDGVLDELSSPSVTVVPLLTSEGHYARVVLPGALARNRRFPEVSLRQTPVLGTHSGLAALVARRVTELLRERGLHRQSVSLAIVGHGTARHQGSRESAILLADTLRKRRVTGEVMAAFIDDDPPLESLIDRAASATLIVVPFLLGGGSHAGEDLPRRLAANASSALDIIIDRPVGEYPGLDELVVDLARRHTPPPRPRFRPRGRAAPRAPGSVHLVGSGPGDPGLMTVKGMEQLRRADVVVHDRLIGSELLEFAPPGALLIDVGKGPGHAPFTQSEINALLVRHARRGHRVVRLKGGDPFVFGRGSEEAQACRDAGIPVEVVPGISSAIAVPAAAGIPVTARGVAQSFSVITGQRADDAEGQTRFSDTSADTLVVLMGRANLRALIDQMIADGRDPATPAACIQSGTTPQQRVTRATLSTLAEAVERDGLESPVVTVIGKVAALGDERHNLYPGMEQIGRAIASTA
jgi:uroporphyrin-III C-methyltransferase